MSGEKILTKLFQAMWSGNICWEDYRTTHLC